MDFEKEIKKHFNEIINSSKGSKAFKNKLKAMQADNFENLYTCFKRCPDNFIGEVDGKKFVCATERYKEESKIQQLGEKGKRNIVVILESPHKDEFHTKLIAPALGETGERLDLYLEKILKRECIAKTSDKLFLVNTVQYQCSLGFSTTCVRNHVFNFLFDKKEIQDDFITRLDKQNPKIIIIATTSFCRDKVKDLVIKHYRDKDVAIYVADSHPSVWTAKTSIMEL